MSQTEKHSISETATKLDYERVAVYLLKNQRIGMARAIKNWLRRGIEVIFKPQYGESKAGSRSRGSLLLIPD
jgi:hypothetical protein